MIRRKTFSWRLFHLMLTGARPTHLGCALIRIPFRWQHRDTYRNVSIGNRFFCYLFSFCVFGREQPHEPAVWLCCVVLIKSEELHIPPFTILLVRCCMYAFSHHHHHHHGQPNGKVFHWKRTSVENVMRDFIVIGLLFGWTLAIERPQSDYGILFAPFHASKGSCCLCVLKCCSVW